MNEIPMNEMFLDEISIPNFSLGKEKEKNRKKIENTHKHTKRGIDISSKNISFMGISFIVFKIRLFHS